MLTERALLSMRLVIKIAFYMNLEPNTLKISVLEVGALLKNNDDATDLPVVCMSKKHMVYSGLQ